MGKFIDFISSGFPNYGKKFVMKLTQIRHGWSWFLAADDFQIFCGCWRRAHLVFVNRLARGDSVAVVIHLSTIFDHTKLLNRLHHIMWLGWRCRRDVGLLVEMWWLNMILDILRQLVIVEVIEDELVVLIDFLVRLVEHLRRKVSGREKVSNIHLTSTFELQRIFYYSNWILTIFSQSLVFLVFRSQSIVWLKFSLRILTFYLFHF